MLNNPLLYRSLALFVAIACSAAVVPAESPASAKSQLFHNEDCDAHFHTVLALTDGGRPWMTVSTSLPAGA
jgi:hypothetical protein